MVRRLFKSLVLFVVLVLVFSVVGIAAARPEEPLKLATLYGKFDFTSEEEVTVIVELEAVSIVEGKHTGISQSAGKLKTERDKVVQAISTVTP